MFAKSKPETVTLWGLEIGAWKIGPLHLKLLTNMINPKRIFPFSKILKVIICSKVAIPTYNWCLIDYCIGGNVKNFFHNSSIMTKSLTYPLYDRWRGQQKYPLKKNKQFDFQLG